jgi:long-chain fatty acid transport protein
VKLFVFLLLLLMCSSVSWATNGADFVGRGTKQSGTAGAGAAEPQDSTWMTINPASIIDLPNTIDFHYDALVPRRKVKMAGDYGYANPNEDVDTGISYQPNMSLVYELSENERLGLGLFTMAGANTHLSNARTTGGHYGGYDRNVDYWTMKLQTVYAKKFSNGWSLGFGPSIIYSQLRTDISTGDNVASQTKGNKEWDKSWGAGFSLGVYKRWEKWAFGAGYTSTQWTQGFDKYDDVFGPIDQPQNLQAGLSYEVVAGVKLLLDYKWIDWTSVDFFGDNASKGGYGWSDSHILKTGVLWDVTAKTTLRAGYSYGKSPMGSEDVFANSLFPTPIEHHVSCGFTHKITETLDFSMSYIHGFKKSFTEDNKDIAVGGGTEVSLEMDIISLGLTWYF